MFLNLLILITINVFIADGIILTESLLNQLGFSKSISSIHINNTNITEIDTNAFKEYINITSVYLRLNKLSTMDLKVFKSFSTKLKYILISASSLTKFTNSEKTKFPSLKVLNCHLNSLLSLDSDVINGLPNLIELIFFAFQMSPLNPNQLSSLKKLEFLRLTVKHQTSLSRAHFNGLTSLRSLEFYSSNIQKIDNDTFKDLANLEFLNFEHHHLLNQLDLSLVSGKLTSLHLNLNNLSHLRMPKRLDNLTRLELSFNRFKSFRSIDFNAFPNLSSLDLSENPHDNSSEISTYLKPLVNLRYANFRNMSIRGTIDSSFFKFNPTLYHIDLSHNRIEKIASNAFNNLNLYLISLSNNLLTELDNSVFSGQKMLVRIVLENNKLSNIGAKTFNNLTMLEYVYLNNNSLTKLDNLIFSGCNGLKDVYLYNNTNLHKSNLQNVCPTEAMGCKIHY